MELRSKSSQWAATIRTARSLLHNAQAAYWQERSLPTPDPERLRIHASAAFAACDQLWQMGVDGDWEKVMTLWQRHLEAAGGSVPPAQDVEPVL